MLVYIFREGKSNFYKIGSTRSDDADVRRKKLNTGSSQGLFLFDTVETDNIFDCERFFHNLLPTRKVGLGGKDFFEMDSEDHMRQTIEKFREMQSRREEAKRAIFPFEKVECSKVLIEPTADDIELLSQLKALDIERLKTREKTAYLDYQYEVIANQLKQRIGGSLGIRGVATWETKIRRNFSEDLLRERDPELYQELLERFHCLDTASWREKQPAHYKQIQTTYFVPFISRKFEILG